MEPKTKEQMKQLSLLGEVKTRNDIIVFSFRIIFINQVLGMSSRAILITQVLLKSVLSLYDFNSFKCQPTDFLVT